MGGEPTDEAVHSTCQAAGEQRYKRRLQQPPLVVAHLRPGIGKKDVRPSERPRHKHVTQYFNGVVLNDTLIVQAFLGDQLAQVADTRRVDFDAEIVVFRVQGGNRCRSLAHAKTDFENARCHTSEQRIEIEACRRVRNANLGHHLLMIALLGIRHPPLTANEAANMPGPRSRIGTHARARIDAGSQARLHGILNSHA